LGGIYFGRDGELDKNKFLKFGLKCHDTWKWDWKFHRSGKFTLNSPSPNARNSKCNNHKIKLNKMWSRNKINTLLENVLRNKSVIKWEIYIGIEIGWRRNKNGSKGVSKYYKFYYENSSKFDFLRKRFQRCNFSWKNTQLMATP
jgi:hypothetical protein